MFDEPATKKLCFMKGWQGKKNEDLARAFEAYGVPLRVRCKLCYQDWFDKKVQLLAQEGSLVRDELNCVGGGGLFSVGPSHCLRMFLPPFPPFGVEGAEGGKTLNDHPSHGLGLPQDMPHLAQNCWFW